MTWTLTRAGIYAACLAIVGGVAAILAYLGYGSYTPSTYMFDLGPLDVRVFAGWIAAAIAGPLLALVAVAKRWGRK
jgi:hypothetical protein